MLDRIQAHPQRNRIRAALLLVALTCMSAWGSSAWAMKQCPHEFGPKDPIVDVIGWIVLLFGIVLGIAFAVHVIHRTRATRLKWRLLGALGALTGMMVIGVGGLMLSMIFFLSC